MSFGTEEELFFVQESLDVAPFGRFSSLEWRRLRSQLPQAKHRVYVDLIRCFVGLSLGC